MMMFDYDPETITTITKSMDVDAETAKRLIDAAKPLWRVLDGLAWTDAHGGAEFGRVFPVALGLIRDEANPTIDGTPHWAKRVAASV